MRLPSPERSSQVANDPDDPNAFYLTQAGRTTGLLHLNPEIGADI